MTKIVNEQRDTTALVERYVGTAYDKMAELHANLANLSALQDSLTEYQNGWQMAATAPTTRADGSALVDGDRYYNTSTKNTYVYVGGNWVNQNASSIGTEIHTIQAGNIVGSDTVVTLTGNYEPGTNALDVYVSGVYQYSQAVDASGAYVETDSQTITFPNTQLNIGEIITINVKTAVNTVTPLIGVNSGLYVAETVNQYVLPLPNGMSYIPGEENLEVHINGLLKYVGVDYTETSSTSITVSSPLQPGDQVVFRQGDILGNDGTLTGEVSYVPTVSVIYDNRANLDTTRPLIALGGTTVGDGSGGIFVYDATASKADANGVTLYDPTAPTSSQGSFTGNGCWARQYEGFIFPSWFNTPYRGVAALRSIEALPGDKVNLEGFYEGSTVGGGIFIWDASEPATNHDGGTIISPLVTADPGTTAWYTAPSSGVGCWIRQRISPLSVAWYGAKPDGVTDSALAFQKAIAAGNPEVPVGTYSVSLALVGSCYSFGAVSIVGAGSVNSIKNLLL